MLNKVAARETAISTSPARLTIFCTADHVVHYHEGDRVALCGTCGESILLGEYKPITDADLQRPAAARPAAPTSLIGVRRLAFA